MNTPLNRIAALMLSIACTFVASVVACGDCGGATAARTEPPPLELTEDRVSIHGRSLDRRKLLQQLAALLGADLVGAERVSGRTSLELTRVSLPVALSHLLAGQSYSLRYRDGRARASGLPNELLVGESAGPREQCAEGATQELSRVEVAHRSDPAFYAAERGTPNSPGRLASGSATDAPPLRRDVLALGSPEQRGVALRTTPPVGSGGTLLRKSLQSDPDPHLRAQAAKQLALADDFASTRALLKALDDGDTQVVVAALDALAERGDSTIVPELAQTLDDHPELAVRAALQRTTDALQAGARLDPELPEFFEYERPQEAALQRSETPGVEPSGSLADVSQAASELHKR